MTNFDRLMNANILPANADLTQEQRDAIESLTQEEVDALVSVKNKTAELFHMEDGVAPVQHHD